MLAVDYICQECGKKSSDDNPKMTCEHCGGVLRGESTSIAGTRDSFGIKNAFVTPEGKKVDNWKSWEKEGYRNPLQTIKNHEVKERVKMKMTKIKKGLT